MNARAAAPLLIVLTVGSCSSPRPVSTAERYNQELRTREAAARPRPEHPPTPAFTRAWRPVVRETLTLPTGAARDLLDRPTRCAASSAGEVFLANRRSRTVYAWRPGGELRTLPAAGHEAPFSPMSLAWSHAEGLLYVLDAGATRVLKYRPDGTLAGEVPLNSGQSPFALDVLEGGGLLVGGERWVTLEHATLLARYEADGRFRGESFPMDPAVIRGNMHLHTPVLLAADGPRAVYAAEPTSYRWMKVGTDGRVLGAFGRAPQGYRAPTPLPPELPPLAEVEAWLARWTPQIFLHAGGGLVFSAFEVRRPYRGFSLEVYDADGRHLAGGLLSEARPSCGQGTRVFFLRAAGPGRVELRAYDYAGPRAPRGPAAAE